VKRRMGRLARLVDVLDSLGVGEPIDPPARQYRAPDTQTPINAMREKIRAECRAAVDYVRGK
jgi:hypothetical protein